MATQSSTLYATNIRHMLDDLTPEKDVTLNVNMDDDVIRGAISAMMVLLPSRRRQKFRRLANRAAPKAVELTAEEKIALELEKEKAIGRRQAGRCT